MMTFKHVGLCLALLLLSAQAIAQQTLADSLASLLEKQAKDTTYIKYSNQLATLWWNSDTDKALAYASDAMALAKELGFKAGEARAGIGMGWIYYRKGDIDNAFLYSKTALALAESIAHDTLQAEGFINLAAVYNEQGQLEESFSYFEKALAINKKLNNKKAVARCLNNLAYTAFKRKDYKVAQQYADEAIQYISSQVGDKYFLGFALRCKGDIMNDLGMVNQALSLWKQAMETAKETGNKSFKISCLNRIGKGFYKQKQFAKALPILEEAQQIALQHGFRPDRLDALGSLADTYHALGQHERAFASQKAFIALHDSLFDEDRTKKLAQMQTHFESEKKAQEIAMLKMQQEQAQAQYAQKSQQQRLTMALAILIGVSAAVIIYLIFRNRQKIARAYDKLTLANEAILEKNQEISQQADMLRKTQAQLVQTEKIASLATMVSGIAHELNNPLNFIAGGVQAFAELYQQDLKPLLDALEANPDLSSSHKDLLSNYLTIKADLPALLHDIQQGTLRSEAIIKSLQVFSTLQDSSQFIDVQAGEILQLVLGKFDSQKIALSQEANMPRIYGNPSQLKLALSNIIANAMDAIGSQGKVDISVAHTPSGVSIAISDNGPGIPPHIKDKIFDPFFTTKPIGKGVGLGLSVSYAIIQSHGGSIEVGNVQPHGTCVTVRLPLAK